MTTEQSPTAALWQSYDRLTRPTRARLTRDDRTIERVMLPSLLDQLADAIESGAGSSAHGVPASKPPLDVLALSLLLEIADTVRTGCWNWHLKRTYDTPLDLRHIVSAVIAHGDPAEIELTANRVHLWGSQIKTVISSDPDRTWRMHGGTCRVCSSTTIPVWLDDGTEARQPALIVHSTDGIIDTISCDFCGSALTGDDLVAIVNDTLSTPLAGRKRA